MVSIVKKSNWPRLLNDFIDSRRETPFQWGRNDCALFCADAVQAVTGNDFAEAYRGRYSTAIGSVIALRDAGHDSIASVITGFFGDPVPVDYLQRGDIAFFNHGRGDTIGIVCGANVAAPGESGLVFFDMSMCEKGWRVCRKR